MKDRYNLLRQCQMDIAISGRVIKVCSYGLPELKIPDTDLYLDRLVGFDTLVEASGIKVFDYAMPVDWIRHNYWSRGLPTPRGVWSYDYNRAMGDFVSLGDMLQMIGEYLRKVGITQIYGYA